MVLEILENYEMRIVLVSNFFERKRVDFKSVKKIYIEKDLLVNLVNQTLESERLRSKH